MFFRSEDEVKEDPTILQMLSLNPEEAPDGVLKTRAYREHPQVAKALERGWRRPLPLAVYVDGVCFRQQAAGRSDTVGGFWLWPNCSAQKR